MENNKSTLVKKLFLLTMISLLLIFSFLGFNLFNTNKSLTKTNFINTNDSNMRYKEIETGSFHSGAVLNDGKIDHLYMWGKNTNGEIGNGEISNVEKPTDITQGNFKLEEGESIKQVSLGYSFSMAVLNDGEEDHLYTWGSNEFGQLGLNDNIDRKIPTEVSIGEDLSGKKTISKISTGVYSSMAVINDGTTDHLYSWGKNDQGQLGLGTQQDEISPKEVSIGNGDKVIKGLYSEASTSFAVLNSEDGDVLYGWGDNGTYQLGIWTEQGFATRPSIVQIGEDLDPSTTTIKDVSVGWVFSAAILNDKNGDHLFTWGDNHYGELGNGETGGPLKHPTEIQICEEFGDKKIIKQISLGSQHSGVIINDGTTDHLYTWGDNVEGQLGLGGHGLERMFEPLPIEVSFNDELEKWKEIKKISFRENHSSVIVSDGTNDLIYLWGSNDYGESGHGGAILDVPKLLDGFPIIIEDPTSMTQTNDGADFYINIIDGTEYKSITSFDLSIKDQGTVEVEGGGNLQVGNNHIIVGGLGSGEEATVIITLGSKMGNTTKDIDVVALGSKEAKSLSFESVDEIKFDSANINVNVMTTESPSNASDVKDYKLLVKDTHSSTTWESNVLNKDEKQSVTISGLESETTYSLTIEIEGKESSRVSIDDFITEDIPFNLKEDSFDIDTNSIKGTSFIFNIGIDTKPSYDPTSFNHNNLHLYSNDEELKLEYVSFDKTDLYTYKVVNLKPKTEYNNFEFSIHQNGSKKIIINDPLGNVVSVTTKSKSTMIYVWGTLSIILLILLIIGAVFAIIWFLKSRNNGGGNYNTSSQW